MQLKDLTADRRLVETGVPGISGHHRPTVFINARGSDVLDCWETLQESGVGFQPHAAV